MNGKETMRACVLLGFPSGYGHPNLASAMSWLNNQAEEDVKVFVVPETGSAICHNFNKLWLLALMNVNHPFTHFAMIHDDIEVGPKWISKLLDIMAETKADVVSVVNSIKNMSGNTSTGYGDPNDWYDYRRLTVKELQKLPPTFSIDDLPEAKAAGNCLLVNTGCWIADMRRTFWGLKDPMTGEHVFKFWQSNRITRWPNGTYCPEFAPEDWNFSRLCHRYGAKVVATTAIKTIHHGSQHYPNSGDWGSEHDDEMIKFMADKKAAYAQPVADILADLNAKKETCLV
jgi:hypothetical protein